MVCVMPLIRERVKGNEAAKLMSLIGLITVAAPAIAPTLGSLILIIGNWHWIFYLLAFYAVIIFCAINKFLPKAHQVTKSDLNIIQRYASVARNKTALRYLFIQGLSFSVMLIILTNGSFIYQTFYGFTPTHFALIFSLNVVALALINMINKKLLDRYTPPTIYSRLE